MNNKKIKYFVHRVCKFVVFFIISIFTIFFIVILDLKQSKNRFRLPENITSLIVGHSHSECGYDDSDLVNLKNISSSGESYFYTYLKLKQLIESNPKLDTVYIEFSNNQIDYKMDNWIWGDEYLENFFLKYAYLLSFEDLKLLSLKNPKGIIKILPRAFKKNFALLIDSSTNIPELKEWGAYKKNNRKKSKKDSKNDSKKELKLNKLESGRISLSNIEYLQKIVDFLNKKNIEFIFIRTPVQNRYSFLANENQFQDIRQKFFEGIEFLDFQKMKLSDDMFADPGHLNIKGAQTLTKHFMSVLNEFKK